MFPIKSLSKSLLLFALLINSFVFLSSPGFAGKSTRHSRAALQTQSLERAPLRAAINNPLAKEMVDFANDDSAQVVDVADENVCVSDQSNNWTNWGLDLGLSISRSFTLGSMIALGLTWLLNPLNSAAASYAMIGPACNSIAAFIMTKIAADAVVRKFVGKSTQKKYPKCLSCVTTMLSGCAAAGAGNVIGALSSAMGDRLVGFKYGITEEEDKEHKEHLINPVIKTDDFTLPHELTTLTLEQSGITIAPDEPIHPVYVCLGCTSVITTAGLAHHCQKTDSVEHLKPGTPECLGLEVIKKSIADGNTIKMRKATMDNGVIKLGTMPLENILLLKDSKEVFYICNLTEDKLNKIKGCRTIKTSEGKPGIKVLDSKIEVSDINEEGQYILFDFLASLIPSETEESSNQTYTFHDDQNTSDYPSTKSPKTNSSDVGSKIEDANGRDNTESSLLFFNEVTNDLIDHLAGLIQADFDAMDPNDSSPLVRIQKANMLKPKITLENVPIENILLLQDKNKVVYSCVLATAFLDKIQGCRTLGTETDRNVIKYLKVNTDLSHIDESGQLLGFDELVRDIIGSDSMTVL